MSNVVPFDTLAVALALRDEAGLDQKQAEGFARVLSRMLVADLVTKADLTSEAHKLDARLTSEAQRLEANLTSEAHRLEANLTSEAHRLEANLTSEAHRLDAKLMGEAQRLEAKIETTVAAAKVDIIKWLFGTIVAQTGIIIAAMKLLH